MSIFVKTNFFEQDSGGLVEERRRVASYAYSLMYRCFRSFWYCIGIVTKVQRSLLIWYIIYLLSVDLFLLYSGYSLCFLSSELCESINHPAWSWVAFDFVHEDKLHLIQLMYLVSAVPLPDYNIYWNICGACDYLLVISRFVVNLVLCGTWSRTFTKDIFELAESAC